MNTSTATKERMGLIRENRNWVWIEFYGRTVKVKKDSITYHVLIALEQYLRDKPIKAFRTTDILHIVDYPTPKISWTLHRLWKQGILERTKKRIVFSDSTNLEHVWGVTKEDIIKYVFQKLEKEERKEFITLYNVVLEKGVVSSREASRYVRNLESWDYLFTQALELVKKEVRKGISFYIDPSLKKEDIESLIKIKLQEILEEIKQDIKRGLKFEEYVYNFFQKLRDKIHFRLTAIERQKRVTIGEKVRIFDLILYFKLYIGDRPIEFLPLLIVPVEVKDQPTGEFYLVKHLIECQRAFSHNFYPLIITSKPRKSAFDTSAHMKIPLLTERDLRKLEGDGNGKEKGGT